MEDRELAKRQLVHAMLDATHQPGVAQRAYLQEAEFHSIVDGLANMWCGMVDTLIKQADDRDIARRLMLHELKNRPTFPMTQTDDLT